MSSSTRTWISLTPTLALSSAAWNDTVTSSRFQPAAVGVGDTVATVAGAVVSFGAGYGASGTSPIPEKLTSTTLWPGSTDTSPVTSRYSLVASNQYGFATAVKAWSAGKA